MWLSHWKQSQAVPALPSIPEKRARLSRMQHTVVGTEFPTSFLIVSLNQQKREVVP